jgi:hypothetical protein
MQVLLRDFSDGIDGLIFDLIKRYLQVKDDNTHKDAWFDYNFEDDDLYWFSIRAALKTKDFNQFAKDVFEILWDKTDTNLNLIRGKIQNEIAQDFNNLFDRLEMDMVELLDQESAQSIVTEIKACSTETQTVIQRISSWFKRSGTQTSDFRLDNLVDIVMEHVNKTHPLKRILLVREFNFNCVIKGEFYTHFADLLRIFLENILKHSGDNAIGIDAKIVVTGTTEALTISIENSVTNYLSIESLKSRTTQREMNMAILLGEKNSGFYKADKILTSDFKNEDNQLWWQLRENETKFVIGAEINLKEITT